MSARIETGFAGVADVPALARLHRAVFPEYRTSRLGVRFCEHLFRGFAASPCVTIFVVRRDSDLIGYCVGGEPAALAEIRRGLRLHALAGAFLHIGSFLDLTETRTLAAQLARRLRRTAPRSSRHSARIVSLHLIGVANLARGLGAGAALLAAFRERYSARYDEAVLSVSRGNAAARRLYESAGWIDDAPSGLTASCCYRYRFTSEHA